MFAKVAVPDQSYVEVNRVICKIHIVFEGGKSLYEQTLVLRNVSFLSIVDIDINNEPVHEISNNVVCVTSKGSDQPAHMVVA